MKSTRNISLCWLIRLVDHIVLVGHQETVLSHESENTRCEGQQSANCRWLGSPFSKCKIFCCINKFIIWFVWFTLLQEKFLTRWERWKWLESLVQWRSESSENMEYKKVGRGGLVPANAAYTSSLELHKGWWNPEGPRALLQLDICFENTKGQRSNKQFCTAKVSDCAGKNYISMIFWFPEKNSFNCHPNSYCLV